MDGKKLTYNCRLELTKNDDKTSTQIGLPYRPARTIMYEKYPLQKIPTLRLGKPYDVGRIINAGEGLKTTYNDAYKTSGHEENVNFFPTKFLKDHKEYSRLKKYSRPLTFEESEYKSTYLLKQPEPAAKGVSVEKMTTCPMVTMGRDEREALPLTDNYNKYLDIYLSTSRLNHRAFTLNEQTTIAMKDVVTTHETMGIPKGRGFGCKFPAFPGIDLDNRDKNMIDKTVFKNEAKLRFMPKRLPKVPNFGSESEMQSAYKRPEGFAMAHLFDRLLEFPGTAGSPSANQTLCPPGMYKTESHAINNHTSPQTVV